MFNNKSNTVCNNVLFGSETILNMHISMTMLYKIAEQNGINGQSALARALNESPQTVKNWESRGISKSGAIKAQETFGCDANELLGRTKKDQAATQSQKPKVEEETIPWGWPFKNISPRQYALLTDRERSYLEVGIQMIIGNRDSKQFTPARLTSTA